MVSSSAVVVVGAGVSGVTCAAGLAAAGQAVVVLERANGVGGRCATRRVGGQPVDHGVAFVHGRDPELLAALRAVPATALLEWPQVIEGTGRPCHPAALVSGTWRLAFAEGMTVFPKHIAAGLDVRLSSRVTRLAVQGAEVELTLEKGAPLRAQTVVLALAAEQASELLGTIDAPPPEVRSARALLDMTRSQPCLALLATYPDSAPRPGWHVAYPESSRLLQLVSHDSSKRQGQPALTLVLQAHPAWSLRHFDDARWPELLLAEAARLYGPWAGAPSSFEAHPWRYSRSDRSAELAGPSLFRLSGGPRLGLIGERFSPGAGIEAAWRSGRRLARRLLEER